jgi:predicted hydrocarbon binding protein
VVSFVDKLLLSRQLRFEEGKLTIFDQRVLIVPVELILLLIEKSVVDRKFEQLIYDVMKKSVYNFCKSLAQRRSVKPKEMVQILINLAEMNGYGKLELIKLDYKTKEAVFHMRHLPSELISKRAKTRVVDRYWAGMLAGGASWIFGKDVDAIETRCVADGKESCEFVVASSKNS